MSQCLDSFTYPDDDGEVLFFCIRDAGHEGQHIAEDCTGLGQIGPAVVPVTFTVMWTVDEMTS